MKHTQSVISAEFKRLCLPATLIKMETGLWKVTKSHENITTNNVLVCLNNPVCGSQLCVADIIFKTDDKYIVSF